MNLEEKFSKLIKEELPGKVGKELQEVLLKAEQDAKSLINLQRKYADLEKLLATTQDSNVILQKELKLHVDLDTKLVKIEEKERNFKITLLETKLEEANKRAEIVKEFTSGLVRNTIFRKQIFDSEDKQVPYTDQYGNQTNTYVNNTKNLTETSQED